MSESKIVVITGGNAGLGLEVVKALLESSESYHIFVGCRGDKSRSEEAINSVKPSNTKSTAEGLSIDVTSDESISSALKDVESKTGYIDVLINNAGASFDGEHLNGNLTAREAWNKSWDTNVSGTYVTTTTFLPLLLKSKSTPRLLFITSGLSSLTEVADGTQPRHTIPDAGWPKPNESRFISYRSAKAGLNMMFLDFSRMLVNDGVKVFDISPGMLATGLGGIGADRLRQMGALDPSVGANFIKDVVDGKRDDQAGKVIRKDSVQAF